MRASKCVIIDLNGFFCEFVSVTNKKIYIYALLWKTKSVFMYSIITYKRKLDVFYWHLCIIVKN